MTITWEHLWEVIQAIIIPLVAWAAWEVRSLRLIVTDLRREVIDHLAADDRRFGVLDNRADDAHRRLLVVEQRHDGGDS